MNTISDLVRKAEAHGAIFEIEGAEINIETPAPLPNDLLAALREHKAEVRVLLLEQCPLTAFDVDTLEALIALGARLAAGEIEALMCGITREHCVTCRGIPCRGSDPLP
jgi:hypothetical protein